MRLLPKSTFHENPALLGNFRPIVLTPTVSKLLSGALRDRWLRHIRGNNYLDLNIQKAFLPTIPRVTEHQAKLRSMIRTVKQQKRSLAVAWLHIPNAYSSVHHALIQFVMAHYHAPPKFRKLLQSWYSGLSATIATDDWDTSTVSLEMVFFQGDPLSIVIFLTVMNTLSDTLSTRIDLGYTLPSSQSSSLSISTNHLLYVIMSCQQHTSRLPTPA